ncbi:MAG: hypothetical protein VXW32_04285 [Myxococcota bacterium]|nr:hypothetical protein [Myxococcota bacterium]
MRSFSLEIKQLCAAGAAVLLPTGCAPDTLPEDLDGLVHFAWDALDEGSTEDLATAFLGLDQNVGADNLDRVFEGALTELTTEQAQMAGVNRDASVATGLFIARDFECDMPALLEVLTTVDQGELYPDGYETYGRSYTSDREAWDRGSEDFLRWDASYSSSLIGATYSAEVDGLLRRVTGLDPLISADGTGVISRLTLMNPVEFEGSTSKELTLNFQLEFFYEREPGRVVQNNATLQHADMGAGVTTDDSAVQAIILSSMASWDDRTEELCAERM